MKRVLRNGNETVIRQQIIKGLIWHPKESFIVKAIEDL